MSKMGTSASSCDKQPEDDDDQSLNSDYSTSHSMIWNNKKFTPLLGGSTISVEYLDLVNETSGFWTFDESVNTRVSHVLSASDEIENNLCSLDSGLNDSNVTDGTLKYYVEENETSDKNNGNENNLIDKDCEKGIIDYANINKRFLVDEGHITETLNEDDRQIFDSGCSGSSVNENPVLEENDMLSENPITVSGQNNENLYTNDKENVILIDTGCQKSELQGIDNIAADLVEDDLTGAVNVVADINLENKANNINIETRADEPKEDDTVNNLTSENNEPKDDTVNNLTSENNEPKEYIVNNLTSESNESKDDIVNNLTSENNESKDDTVDNLTSENNESKDDTVDNLTSENNESKDDTVDNLTCENNESKDDTVDNLTSESNEPKDDTVDNFSGNTEDYFTEENSGSFSSENYRNENNSYKPLFISDSNVSGKMKDLINECIESKTVESAVVVKGGNLHLKTDENCNSQYLLNISDINNEKSCRKKPDILENTKTRTTEEFELSEKQKMTNKVCHFKNKNRKKDLCHGNCDVIKSIDTDDLTQYQENPNGSGDNNDCLKYDNSDSVSMCSERSDTLFDSGDNNISNHDIFDSGDSNISNHDIFDNGDSNISNHDTFDNGDSNISNHDIFDSGDSNISNHDIYDNGDNNISNHDVHSVVSNDRCLNHGLASNNLNQYLISNPLSNNDYINVIKDTESNTKLNNNSRDYKEEVTCSENNKCQDLGCNHLNHIHNSCSNNSSQREDNILEYRIEDNVQTYRPGDLDNRNDVNHDQECNHYYHEHDSSDNKNDVNHDQEYNHYYHEHDSGDKTIDLCQNLEIDNLTCQYEEETKLEDTVTTVNCEKSLSHGKLSTAKCVQGHVIKSCDCNNPINCIHLCKNINQLSIENNDNLSINQDGVLQKHSTDKVLQLCSVSLSVDNNKMVDKHLSNVEPRLQSFQSAEEEVFENKHISDSDDENLSAEDVAYLTCSDDEPDDQCTAESFMKHSQPESGFGETLASNFTTTEKDDFECGLSDKFENFDEPLHEESFEDDDNYYHHRNHLNDDPADNEWGDGTLCGCYECLGRLQIERIVTADKCTMFPDEPPYILTCDICEELLENQLQKTEKDSKKKEADLKKQLKSLKEENEKQHKVIQQNLQLGPEAKIEATMQHEITRLTSENLDLRESLDKNQDKISKLKKMLKVYAKRLKDGEAAEIAAELDKEDTESNVGNVATIKHRERNYMGMLEYRKEDEGVLIKNLIMDLKPRVAVGLLPGLPAYVLFMCVRHTDYVNDDEKVRSLLTNTINGIKKCVKKYHNDLERVMMWFANTCRLLHTLKQYSGEKAFQPDNTARQNEHCLRNFDLSEYRQVFSDLAVWIYQTLIRQMQDTVQQMIVPAVLEHEAIAGLTASKPSGMRGRSSSNAMELEDKELSLDSLMKAMNKFSQILAQHAVDPELIKQIFRQLYYFVCSGALNNLLLRKDMCNWSKGMQIRYNLSHLEQWLRDNKLQESGALTELEPITQASQLLQARKTEADVDSICEMCSQLTTPQIVKILNLYTPVDEFEERVPISFIRKIQHKLKGRQEADNTLLMDTKHSFPVTFPFNPSSIAMETIEVPQQLHLGFLNRH